LKQLKYRVRNGGVTQTNVQSTTVPVLQRRDHPLPRSLLCIGIRFCLQDTHAHKRRLCVNLLHSLEDEAKKCNA
jgi:hypothetical protein